MDAGSVLLARKMPMVGRRLRGGVFPVDAVFILRPAAIAHEEYGVISRAWLFHRKVEMRMKPRMKSAKLSFAVAIEQSLFFDSSQ